MADNLILVFFKFIFVAADTWLELQKRSSKMMRQR